jgi:hypothetical protein
MLRAGQLEAEFARLHAVGVRLKTGTGGLAVRFSAGKAA